MLDTAVESQQDGPGECILQGEEAPLRTMNIPGEDGWLEYK